MYRSIPSFVLASKLQKRKWFIRSMRCVVMLSTVFILSGSVLAQDNPPTIIQAASANPAVITAKTTALSALATDDGGDSTLLYTWSTTGTPPASVTFNRNGTNAAKSVTATFKKSGAYSFLVTITDTASHSVTSSVDVTVNSTLTTITAAPNNKLVNLGATQQFTATAKDQFATLLSPQPTFTWSVSGGGTIDANGLFSATAPGGPFTVNASNGAVSDSATFNVNSPPTLATPAAIDANPVIGTSAHLSVLGDDNSGEAALKYTWASTGPAAATFTPNNSNAAKNSLVGFKKQGSYTLTATIKDASGLTVTSSVNVVVNQTYTSINVTPAGAYVKPSTNKQFSASALDQFNLAMTAQPTFSWTVSGGGTIDASTGLFHAGTTLGGPFVVTASSGAVSGTANVTVDAAPNIEITAPSSGATYPAPATFTIETDAIDVDGTIAKVDFFQNNVKIGTSTSPPFSFTITDLAAGTYTYKAKAYDNVNFTDMSSTILINVTIVDPNPTVATPATASPNPTGGTSTSLSVLGADNGGETNLTYTWSSTGPAAVTFSANGTNAAKNCTATFSKAGSYAITATITDATNLTVTSTVNVLVNQTLTTINVSPANGVTSLNGTLQYSAIGKDQFNTDMSPQPLFSWSVGAGGTISNTGLFTAGSVASGPFLVTATSGSVSGQATITISNDAPYVVNPASATPNPGNDTTTSLSVLGGDDGYEPSLTYSWSLTGTPPAPVTFSANNSNAAKNTTTTFTRSGNYAFRATITDASGLSITSTVTVAVNQTPTAIVVTPGTAGVNLNGQQQFSALSVDQFGAALANQPSFTWSVEGGGSIDPSGLFTANEEPSGPFLVTASGGGNSGTASVTISDAAPYVVTAASANPNPVNGTSTALSVLGGDDARESLLKYTWNVQSGAANAVSFSANGTNAAKNSTATFAHSGNYTLRVTISDESDLSTTSSVNATVNSNAAFATILPATASVPPGGLQQFTATITDQFGDSLNPTDWIVSGGGSIDNNGLFTAGAESDGPFTVTASRDAISATASIVVGVIAGSGPPSFTPGPDQIVLEDSGHQTIPNWATDIQFGGANPQALLFYGYSDNYSLFDGDSLLYIDTTTGTLEFNVKPDTSGIAHLTVVLTDFLGNESAPATFTVTVLPVNHPPSFIVPQACIAYGFSPQRFDGFASQITAGSPNEDLTQTLHFEIVSNNYPEFFSEQPSIDANGTLKFTFAPNAPTGSAFISVVLYDDGGGDDNFGSGFVIAHYNTPSFTPGPNLAVKADSGIQTVQWATDIQPGTAAQSIWFETIVDDNSLFDNPPNINTDGLLIYAPSVSLTGIANVTVILHDDGGTDSGRIDTAIHTFTIHVKAANSPPTAFYQVYNVMENSSAPVILTGEDPDGDELFFSIVSAPQSGHFSGSPPNLIYTPDPNFNGMDSFIFAVSDGIVFSDPVMAWIDIIPIPELGIVTPASATPNPVTGTSTQLSVTASDISGESNLTYTWQLLSGPAAVSLQGNGTNAAKNLVARFSKAGSYQLQVTVADAQNHTLTSSVGVTVQLAAKSVTVSPMSVIIPPGATQQFIASVVDQFDNPLINSVTWSGAGVDQNGLFSAGSSSAGPITVTASRDGKSGTASVIVDRAPVATPQTLTLNEDTPTSVVLSGSDPDNDMLSFIIVSGPQHGAMSGSGANRTYTPALNYFGSDSFTFKANDSRADSALATVSLTINPINDSPSFTVGANLTVQNNTGFRTFANWATGVSAGPANESGQHVSFTITANDHPELFSTPPAVSPAGLLTFEPSAGATGLAHISIQLQDDGGTAGGGVNTSATQTFTINMVTSGETLPIVPLAPSNLAATIISPVTINLNWTDASSDETGFKIERKNGAGSFVQIATVAANVTTYSDIGVSSATQYTYRVRAVSSVGNSAYSNESTATTPIIPATSTNLAAAAISFGEIDLTWTDNANNETAYKIERKMAGGTYSQIGSIAANSVAFADTTVLPNTTYYYRVRASTAAADSAYSNVALAGTPDIAPQTAPVVTAPAGAIASRKPQIQWTSATSATAYEIWIDDLTTATSPVLDKVVSDTPYTLATSEALTDGHDYQIRVRGSNSSGNGPWSAYQAFHVATGGTPVIIVVANDASISESSSSGTSFNVLRSGDLTDDLTIQIAVSGTASNGEDYASLDSTYVFPANTTVLPIGVLPIDDSDVEGNETVIVTLAAGAGYGLGTPTSATITIVDDDPNVTVVATQPSASEVVGNGGLFTLSRTGNLNAALTVNFTVSGTATSVDDYYALGSSIVIPAGVSSVNLPVTVKDDLLKEGDETVVLTLTSGSYFIGTQNVATVTIADNDMPIVSIAATASAAEAGLVPGAFTVTRTGDPSSSLTVYYSVSAQSTAASGSDYLALSGSVVIPAGQASAAVVVTPLQDSLAEGDEVVIVELSNNAGYLLGDAASASLTIVDDDVPTVTIALLQDNASESGISGAFRVTRTGTSGALSVHYNVGGSASADDLAVPLSGTVVIADGQNSADIVFTPVADSELEGTETVILTLLSDAAYTIGDSSSATASILDTNRPFNDDFASAQVLSGALPISASGTNVNATTQTGEPDHAGTPAAQSVWWSWTPAASGSIAVTTDGSDFDTVLAIYTGSNVSGLTPVVSNDDGGNGSTSRVTFAAQAGVTYYIAVDGFASASGTIQLAVMRNQPVVSVIATADAAEAGTVPGTFTVSRAGGDNSAPLTVNITLGGSATADDYVLTADGQPVSTAVTIPALADSIDVLVAPIDDTVAEGSETVELTISEDVAYVLGSSSFATVTIADDDMPVLTIAANVQSANEAGPVNGSFLVTRSVISASPLSIKFSIGGSATNGTDYVAISTLTIPAGQASVSVPVIPITDGIMEGTETVTLTLESDPAYGLGDAASATVYIYDADLPVVTISATTPQASENGTPGVVTFTRTGTAGAVTVNFTLGGSATEGSDYAFLPRAITIPAGQSSATLPIQPIDDSETESPETVVVRLAGSTSYSIGTPHAATVTILDNDLPVVTVTASDALASEIGNDTGTFTFTRSNVGTSDLDVHYLLSGTATNGVDYKALSGTARIPAGLNSVDVVVTPIDDLIYENAESVIATLSTNSAYQTGAPNSATVTIGDNDKQTFVVYASDPVASFYGSNTGAFEIRRLGSSNGAATVNYSISGSAFSGIDFFPKLDGIFVAVIGSITFASGETSKTVIIEPQKLVGGNKTVVMTLASSSSSDVASPSSAVVTITDHIIQLGSGGDTTENGLATGFSITRSGPPIEPGFSITVAYQFSGTASGNDYSASPISAVAFNSDNPFFRGVTITPVNDNIPEDDETITLTIYPGSAYVVVGQSSATVKIIDNDLPVVNATVYDDYAAGSANTGEFVLRRNGRFGSPLTVPIQLGGTAVAGVDYESVPTTVTFPAGSSAVGVTITPIDSNYVGGKTVSLTVLSNAAYTIGTPTATMSLEGTNAPVVSVSATSSEIYDSGMFTTSVFTFTRTGPTFSDLIVNYTVGGTATAGDYTLSTPGSVIIYAGSTTASVILTAVQSQVMKGDRTVDLQISSSPSYNRGPNNLAEVTLHQTVQSVTISSNGFGIENDFNSPIIFTVTRNFFSSELYVYLDLNGTAAPLSDYVTFAPPVVHFMAGQTSATYSVYPAYDGVADSYEYITATIIHDSNNTLSYNIGSPSSATATIYDNSSVVSLPGVAAETWSPFAYEATGEPGYFLIRRSAGNISAPLTVYRYTGNDFENAPYVQLPSSVTIPAGEYSVLVPLMPIQDSQIIGDLSVIFQIKNDSSYTILSSSNSVTIIDDDAPVLTLETVSDTAVEGGAPATLKLTRNASISGDASVTTGDDLPVFINYSTLQGLTAPTIVHIPAGQNSVQFNVIEPQNNTIDGTREISVSILPGPFHYTLGSSASTVINATDNDAPNVYIGTYSFGGNSVGESGAITLYVARTGDTSSSLAVNVAVGGTAIPAVDYSLDLGSYVLFNPGQSTTYFTLTPFRDGVVETDETATFSIVPSNTYNILPGLGSTTVTITDDDSSFVWVVASASTADENGTPGRFTFKRNGSLNQDLTINFELSGSASLGTNYSLSAMQVVFPAGVDTVDIDLTPINDGVYTGAQSVILTLEPSLGAILGSPSSAQVSIADAQPPALRLIIWQTTASPGDTVYALVSAGAVVESDINVNMTIAGIPGTAVINAGTSGSLVPINISDNATGSITVAIFNGAGYTLGVPNTGTITILQSVTGVPSNDGGAGPDANNPPTITINNLEITAGLTGDENGQLNGEDVFFTKNQSVTLHVVVQVQNGNLDEVIFTASGDGGTFTASVQGGGMSSDIEIPAEGRYRLSASASASNAAGLVASETLADGDSKILIVDRTAPAIAFTLPVRYSLKDDADIVFINGASDNTTLRAQGLNCYTASEFTVKATVLDFSGLTDKGGECQAKVKEQSGTIAVTLATAQDGTQTLTAGGLPELTESATFDNTSLQCKNYKGRYTYQFKLEDRCGNVLDGGFQDQFKLWVDRTPPSAQPAIQQAEKYNVTIEKDGNTELSNARHIVSTFDCAYGTQSGGKRLLRAYKGPITPDQPATTLDDAKAGHILPNSASEANVLSAWLLPSPLELPVNQGKSTQVTLRDMAGNSSSPVGVTFNRKNIQVPTDVTDIEQGLPKSNEQPVRREDDGAGFDKLVWHFGGSITEGAEQSMSDPTGNEGYRHARGKLSGGKAKIRMLGSPDVNELLVGALGFTGNVAVFPVTPIDPKDGPDRHAGPAVVNLPPSWETDAEKKKINVVVKDEGIREMFKLYDEAQQFADDKPDLNMKVGVNSAGYSDDSTDDLVEGKNPARKGADSFTAKIDLANAVPGLARVSYKVDAKPTLYSPNIPYHVFTGFRWMNCVSVKPDVISTGNVVTLRIYGGYINKDFKAADFSDATDYVGIGTDSNLMVRQGTDLSQPNDTHSITILRDPKNTSKYLQKLVMVEGQNETTVQAIELTVEIGKDVSADLYNIDVKCGGVKMYQDPESVKNAGSMIALSHRMNEALDIISWRWTNVATGKAINSLSMSQKIDPISGGVSSRATSTPVINGPKYKIGPLTDSGKQNNALFGPAVLLFYSDDPRKPESKLLKTVENFDLEKSTLTYGDYREFSFFDGDREVDTDAQYIIYAHPGDWIVGRFKANENVKTEPVAVLAIGFQRNDIGGKSGPPINPLREQLSISNYLPGELEEDDREKFRVYVYNSQEKTNELEASITNDRTGQSEFMTLRRTEPKSPRFVSDRMGLVSDMVDYKASFKLNKTALLVQLQDPITVSLRRGNLDDEDLHTTYFVNKSPESNTKNRYNGDDPLLQDVRTVKIEAVVYSRGGVPCWTDEEIDYAIRLSNETYARCGVKVERSAIVPGGEASWDATIGFNPENRQHPNRISPDFEKLLEKKSKKENTITAYFIDHFNDDLNEVFMPGVANRISATYGFAMARLNTANLINANDKLIVNSVVISHHSLYGIAGVPPAKYTLAHELAHILTNLPDKAIMAGGIESTSIWAYWNAEIYNKNSNTIYENKRLMPYKRPTFFKPEMFEDRKDESTVIRNHADSLFKE